MKNDLLHKLTDLLREKGFDQISMSEIGKVTNLQKSSLYHHFPGGKNDIVKSILIEAEKNLKRSLDKIINGPENPNVKFESLLTLVSTFYNEGKKNCLIDVVSISNIDDEVDHKIKDIYEILIDAFITIYQQLGFTKTKANEMGLQAIIMIQGSLVVSRAINHNKPFLTIINTLKKVDGYESV